MFQNPQMLNYKLREVLDLLDENKQEFEIVEKDVKDQDLRQVILQLISKNTEYANQLIASLKPGENRLLKKGNNVSGGEMKTDKNKTLSQEDLLEKCRKDESAFEKTYREVLNLWFIQDGLRNTMQFQLNELKTLFLKIRISYMVKSNMISPYTLRKKYF